MVMKWLLSIASVALVLFLLPAMPAAAQSNYSTTADAGPLADRGSIQAEQQGVAEFPPGILEPAEPDPPKIYSIWALLAILAALALVAWAGLTIVRRGLQNSRKRRRKRRRHSTA